MIRRFIDSLTMLVAWLRRKRKIQTNTSIVKINLGSGLAVAPGWSNIDCSLNSFFSNFPRVFLRMVYRLSGSKQWYPKNEYIDILKNHTFVNHKLKYGIPFDNGTVEFIYTSHFLHFLFRDDAEKLLNECFRVLKNGGRIRICVPDLEHIISLYVEGRREEALGYFFPITERGILRYRRYMYDFDLLKRLLEKCGFDSVEKFQGEKGSVPDIHLLDNRPEHTLFVEASKIVVK